MKSEMKQLNERNGVSPAPIVSSCIMSVPPVPYATQLGDLPEPTQQHRECDLAMLYLEDMTAQQTVLMQEVPKLVCEKLIVKVITVKDLMEIQNLSRSFVIPYPKDEIIKMIKSRVHKPTIYTARCVVESRKFHKIPLPVRTLAVSLSMLKCKIFLVENCNEPGLRKKIHEMCGKVLADFKDPDLNVLVTNRADDKFCTRARQRNIVVVSEVWVEDNYDVSRSDDSINHDALSNVSDYRIKPFLGLRFRLKAQSIKMDKELRDFVENKGGKIALGVDPFNHVIADIIPEDHLRCRSKECRFGKGNSGEARIVDMDFLRACASVDHYMTRKEYRLYKEASAVKVKEEKLSQPMESQQPPLQNCFTPPQLNPQSTMSSIRSNGYDRMNENQSMPPPTLPRPARHIKEVDMNDIILKALSSYDNGTQQTQLPSTQMRSIPENDIRFERAPEASQQLYWTDSVPRKKC